MKIRIINISFIIVIVLLLLVVRYYEYMFYDPLKTYFETEYLYATKPIYSLWKLLSSVALKYWLNTLLSLGVIYFIFQNFSFIDLSIKIYLISFFLLLTIFIILLQTGVEKNYLAVYYIRRILTQPLLLIILVPAFYYQVFTENN
jgi:exosortase F-associated protein